jgi:ubiquinone/menaquinone biosynthesis C-methylase UbiE
MNRFHRWFCRSGLWRHALEARLLPWAMDGIALGEELLEIGPGPGLTTDLLRRRFQRITAIEIDSSLGRSLGRRMVDLNVRVVQGDATTLPFADQYFSGAVCFTMLHHVPSELLQNRLLAEVCRVLKPGGMFAGADSLFSRGMQLIHMGDSMITIDPAGFGPRLAAAGFDNIRIDARKRMFRFSARRP